MEEFELAPFFELCQDSLQIRSHFELFLWLQGNFQNYLSHEIMIAAWGDFSLGLVYFDIVSTLPGMRTDKINSHSLAPILKKVFSYWFENHRSPIVLSLVGDEKNEAHRVISRDLASHFSGMRYAMTHAIKDNRGRHDCLYLLLGSSVTAPKMALGLFEALIPYIDTAFRQVEQLGTSAVLNRESDPQEAIAEEEQLSLREIEIMSWVCQGKTNSEIGLILDISSFTVKNHLQRIFRKMDVLNRSQAVSKFNSLYQK